MILFYVIMNNQPEIFLRTIFFNMEFALARSFSKFFLSLRIIMLEKLNTVWGDFCFVLVTIFFILFRGLISFVRLLVPA